MRILFDTDEEFGVSPLPPERLEGKYANAEPVSGKYFSEMSWVEQRTQMEKGYQIEPSDCPVIRHVSRYGYVVRSPGEATIILNKAGDFEKEFSNKYSRYGYWEIIGQNKVKTDSQYIISWIGNSPYFKICTGIVFYCPVEYGMYHGEIPYGDGNDSYRPVPSIQFGNSLGVYEVLGEKYFKVEATVVCKLADGCSEAHIKTGQMVGVFYPVLKPHAMKLERLPREKLIEF